MIRPHFIAQLLELIETEILRGHIDEVALCRMTMLPIDGVTRLIDEPLQLAHRLSQHLSIVGFVDNPVVPFVLFQERWRKVKVAEPATAFPADSFGDSTLVSTVNNFLQ